MHGETAGGVPSLQNTSCDILPFVTILMSMLVVRVMIVAKAMLAATLLPFTPSASRSLCGKGDNGKSETLFSFIYVSILTALLVFSGIWNLLSCVRAATDSIG